MPVLIRALTYAAIFVAFVLVALPAEVLEWSGVERPPTLGPAQLGGGVLVAVGGALALWCVLTFALRGHGTPAPFDPPRRLVVSGPYRFVRNPMYLGAAVALSGAALFYRSLALLAFTAGFLGVAHAFVVLYEEPALARAFGAEYDAYRSRVRRWRPTWRGPRPSP